MKNYIVNGRVEREEIASDIAEGYLTREELNELIKNPEIQNAFIGTSFDLKGDRRTWDKRYLNNLVNASVAEAFNKQYLYHLFEVADYLKKDNKHSGATISKKSWALIAAVIVVLVVASIICFLVKSRN